MSARGKDTKQYPGPWRFTFDKDGTLLSAEREVEGPKWIGGVWTGGATQQMFGHEVAYALSDTAKEYGRSTSCAIDRSAS